MGFENFNNQNITKRTLVEARAKNYWWEVAAMSGIPAFRFDDLTSDESQKVHELSRVLKHLYNVLEVGEFSDGIINVQKVYNYLKSLQGNKLDEKTEVVILALVKMFNVVDEERFSGGNVLQYYADNAKEKVEESRKLALDSIIDKVKDSKLQDVYQEGIKYLKSKCFIK